MCEDFNGGIGMLTIQRRALRNQFWNVLNSSMNTLLGNVACIMFQVEEVFK